MEDELDPNREYYKSFDLEIDDGGLDGLSPQQVFVLGCEFVSIYESLSHAMDSGSTAFSFVVRPDNRDRLERACEKFRFAAKFSPFMGVPGDCWLLLNAYIIGDL